MFFYVYLTLININGLIAKGKNSKKMFVQGYDTFSNSSRVYVRNIKEVSAEELERLYSQLPQWRKDKADAFRHEQGRRECILSFALLQLALSETFGITDELLFGYAEHDKPYLENHPEVFFNISHCREAVACVVDERPVGIDVECFGRYKESLAKHVLSEVELQRVMESSNPDREFTILWTKKEALLKMTGDGVGHEMKNILTEFSDVKIVSRECDGYAFSVAFE